MTLTSKVVAIFVLFCLLLTVVSFSALAQDATNPAKLKREAARERLETRKETIAQRLDERREKIASRAAALKTRLQTFRDQNKVQIIERLNTNLNGLNDKITAAMLRFLGKMSDILSKLEARVNSGKPDIKDPEAASVAIASASAAIASASAAVNAQAEKDYSLSVSSEVRAKTEIKAVRDSLHADLKTVRELVIAAKQAVGNAIRVAKSGKLEIPGSGFPSTSSGQGKEATQSGQ